MSSIFLYTSSGCCCCCCCYCVVDVVVTTVDVVLLLLLMMILSLYKEDCVLGVSALIQVKYTVSYATGVLTVVI